MYMSGGTPIVKVVLRNPLNYKDQIDYTIRPYDTAISRDWIVALKKSLVSKNILKKITVSWGFQKQLEI